MAVRNCRTATLQVVVLRALCTTDFQSVDARRDGLEVRRTSGRGPFGVKRFSPKCGDSSDDNGYVDYGDAARMLGATVIGKNCHLIKDAEQVDESQFRTSFMFSASPQQR